MLCPMSDRFRALLVVGASGVGKTSVAHMISRLLSESGRPVAFVDLDSISQFGPPPRQWASYDHLRQQNIAALWANFRVAGAQFLVIAGHVNSTVARDNYAAALPDCDLFTVRLVAPTETVRVRIRRRARESGHALDQAIADVPTDPPGRGHLPGEALPKLLVDGEVRMDHLHRDRTAAGAATEIHPAHAAAAEPAQQPVRPHRPWVVRRQRFHGALPRDVRTALLIVLGTLAARNAFFRWLLDPLVSVGFPAPKISLLPIFILWFGLGDTSKLVMIVITCIFPVISATYLGTSSIDRYLIWSARNLGMSMHDLGIEAPL
jgi:energy-coupling factor transporter ATP-binding protein EcfA2